MTFKPKRRRILLMLPALFYFVIGAHALHPHFHEHEIFTPDSSAWKLLFEIDSHALTVLKQAESDHDTCLICDFLAISTATQFGNARLFLYSSSRQKPDTDYLNLAKNNYLCSCHIRGPPFSFS